MKPHPSAALFVGVLIALVLPFGHAVASCGSERADFSGVDLILQDVEPQPAAPGWPIGQSDRDFADSVESNGAPAAVVLLLVAVLGLALALFAGGRLWGTCCFVAALATLAIAVFVNMSDAYIGWHLAFWLTAGGVVTRFLSAVRRRYLRRSERLAEAQDMRLAGGIEPGSRPSSIA